MGGSEPLAFEPIDSAPVLEGGEAFDTLRAQHGFAALVTVTRGDREHRIVFGAPSITG
jgi:hypothetical protein